MSIAGQVPENSQVGSIGDSRYTCNFGFQQEVSSAEYIPDDSVDPVFSRTGGLIQNDNECASDLTYCYIVAGTDAEPPISTQVNTVNTSTGIQNTLESAAADTNNVPYNAVFNSFPGRFSDADVRNPLDVWNQTYGK